MCVGGHALLSLAPHQGRAVHQHKAHHCTRHANANLSMCVSNHIHSYYEEVSLANYPPFSSQRTPSSTTSISQQHEGEGLLWTGMLPSHMGEGIPPHWRLEKLPLYLHQGCAGGGFSVKWRTPPTHNSTPNTYNALARTKIH